MSIALTILFVTSIGIIYTAAVIAVIATRIGKILDEINKSSIDSNPRQSDFR